MTLTARRPEILTELPGPRARAILERDALALSTSYVRPYPFVPDRGEGVWLTDVDGNTMLDFMAGIAVSSTGYNHPHVLKAVTDQAARFMHVCLTDFPQEETTRLAERLSALAGGGFRAFFGNSGAEAVEAAVKLARHHTGRHHVVSTLGSFHGRTYGAITLTGSKANYRRGFGPLLPSVVHVPYPDPFRPPLGSTPETAGQAVLDHLEGTLFHTILPPDEVAAVIVEPMQGEGGYVVPPAGFLRGLRELCDRHGILLIFDEVQAGTGRTGRFLSHQHEGVRPDMITLAKGIASGLPISALLARAEIMTWPPGSHGSTFGGNPVAAAAANATLDLLVGSGDPGVGSGEPGVGSGEPGTGGPDGLMANAERVGSMLLRELRALQPRFPGLGDVRGRGLFVGLEFVDPATNEPAEAYRDALSYRAFEFGLLNLPCGRSSLRLSPPLVIGPDEARIGLEILRRALEETPWPR